MRGLRILGILTLTLLAGVTVAHAQAPEPETRHGVIEREQADKVDTLTPMFRAGASRSSPAFKTGWSTSGSPGIRSWRTPTAAAVWRWAWDTGVT